MTQLPLSVITRTYVVDEGGREDGDGLRGGEVETLANQQRVVEPRLRAHVAVVLLRAVLLDEREEPATVELVVVRVWRAAGEHRVSGYRRGKKRFYIAAGENRDGRACSGRSCSAWCVDG